MFMTNSIRRAAQINPKGVAAIQGERQRLWPECVDRVQKLAGGFVASDVAAGDRIAILANNGDRFLESMYAIYWAGAVMCPINFRLNLEGIIAIVNDAEPRLLLVDDIFAGQLDSMRPRIPSVERIIYIGEQQAPADTLDYEQLIQTSEPTEDALRHGDDLAAIFYTGGTTGDPKGVALTHNNFMSNVMNCTYEMGYQRDSRFLHAAPLFHIGPHSSACALTMHAGTHLFLPAASGFDVETYLRMVERYQITDIMLVPTMLAMVVHSPAVDRYDLTSVRSIQYGGAPISEPLLCRAREVFSNAQFRQFYGMTELCGSGTVLRPEHHHKLASAGQAMFSVELKIVAPGDGRTLPPGATGEIVARSPGVMRGYWRRSDLTAEVLRDGWLHTGDLGYLDEDGFVYVVDRLKDMIISGGENVYSAEVDRVIAQHPAVLECAAIGIPHDTWGEAVHAVVVLKPGAAASEQELIDHCRNHLAGYQCPRSVEIRQERLPVNRAGKILKHVLRQPYWT